MTLLLHNKPTLKHVPYSLLILRLTIGEASLCGYQAQNVHTQKDILEKILLIGCLIWT